MSPTPTSTRRATSSGLDWPFSQPTKLREKKLAASAVREVTSITKDFEELAAPIDADPTRAARAAQERVEAVAEIMAHNLAELRKARQVTQAELAAALETTQSGISRLERQGDLHLSTLCRYVAALGGALEVNAVFDDTVRVPISGSGAARV